MSASFDCRQEEFDLIEDIVKRAFKMENVRAIYRDRLDMMMDVLAVHANGNPLRLKDFLDADDFNFFHDIHGIHRHLDRETGKLDGGFLPRFTQLEAMGAA